MKKLRLKESFINNFQQQKDTLIIPDLIKALNVLLQGEYTSDYMPNQLKNKKEKKGLSKN